ncbi:MAG: helicase-related protein, partial [Flavobacteriales bacterium]
RAFRIDQREKVNFVIKLIGEGDWSQVLVFTRTKHRANRLAEKLVKSHITAAAIHGNKTQNARTKALKEFKEGKVRVLVATDIAARGLDIPLLPHVINFELPNVPEDYVHRIGRTGRAGASGEAISLVDVTEIGHLKDIEKLLGMKVKTTEAEGFEPSDKIPEGAIPPKQKKKPPRGGWKSKGGGGKGSSRGGSSGGNSRGGGSGRPKRSGGSSGNQGRGTNNKGSNSRGRS